jgi:biopolymer transport protein ExbB
MNMLSVLLQIQTTPVAAATTNAATAASQSPDMSYWDLAVKGGIIMIPIAILSLIMVYIFFERYFAIKAATQIDVNFMNRIRDYFHEGKIDAAQTLCKSTNNPVARMIEKGISRIGRPLNDVHVAIENVGRLEIYNLEKGLPILASVAGGAPMLGFLGTVTGMVRAFYDMANAGNNIDIKLLSGGIYEAMITTVAGLIVGILAYFAYNYLVSRIEKVVNKLEVSTTDFLDLLNEPVK